MNGFSLKSSPSKFITSPIPLDKTTLINWKKGSVGTVVCHLRNFFTGTTIPTTNTYSKRFTER